jgi:hypothetical protein
MRPVCLPQHPTSPIASPCGAVCARKLVCVCVCVIWAIHSLVMCALAGRTQAGCVHTCNRRVRHCSAGAQSRKHAAWGKQDCSAAVGEEI